MGEPGPERHALPAVAHAAEDAQDDARGVVDLALAVVVHNQASRPRVHVFGHEHGDPGVFYKTEDYEHSETYYANAGNVSEYYQLRPNPIIFTLVGGVE